MKIESTTSYPELLNSIKTRIQTAQVKAALSVNAEMISLYWEIGKMILDRQRDEGWGAKIIDKLSKDLVSEFPEMKGFSSRNLKYMRKFAEAYPNLKFANEPIEINSPFVQQVVAQKSLEENSPFVQGPLAQITWYHNIALMDKVKSKEERLWYAKQAIKNGWSRNILVHQIESGLYQRQVLTEKTTNYDRTLPSPQSDLAQQTLKDPYIFDFLSLGKKAKERELENELTRHITKFLLELGAGFAYVGKQYHLYVGGKDFYIDLLFYHLKLRCYVAIEIKTGDFKPEYAGKINFYLSALDDLLKHAEDNPSIGIVLCRTKNKVIAEYALRDVTKPIGLAKYKLSHIIPEELQKSLPEPEEIEKELGEDFI
jgi:predicted nuclease of restriction endonuclease-like (RecB) superfamily